MVCCFTVLAVWSLSRGRWLWQPHHSQRASKSRKGDLGIKGRQKRERRRWNTIKWQRAFASWHWSECVDWKVVRSVTLSLSNSDVHCETTTTTTKREKRQFHGQHARPNHFVSITDANYCILRLASYYLWLTQSGNYITAKQRNGGPSYCRLHCVRLSVLARWVIVVGGVELLGSVGLAQ